MADDRIVRIPGVSRGRQYRPIDTRGDSIQNRGGGGPVSGGGGGGGGQKSFLDYNWRLGSVFGISIHVHVLLPLFFVFSFIMWAGTHILYMCALQHFTVTLICVCIYISVCAGVMSSDNAGYVIALILLQNLALWWTVLIHELGHCFAGYLVGGSSDKIILWPLGMQ